MEDKTIETVIVVLNYNDCHTCVNFIQETEKYDVFDKIILVDNCSTDNSVEILNNYINDKIVLLESSENKGYAYGNNVGMRYAVSSYPNLKNIIISNPDIHVSEEDINRILQPLDNSYGMSTGVIYNYNPSTKSKTLASNFGWKLPTYVDMISNCYLVAYKMKRSVFHTSMYLDWNKEKDKDIINTEAVPGCFFALKAEAAKDIDYMDESTFLFGEETILGWRLKNTGYKACIVNGTQVLHENSVSINKNVKGSNIKSKYRFEAEMVYVKRYLKKNVLLQKIFELNYRFGLIEKRLVSYFIK